MCASSTRVTPFICGAHASVTNNIFFMLAEAVRFELTIPCGIPVFETGALDQLCDASVFAILYMAEGSHSGLVRSLGKRVEGNLS